MSSIIKVDTVQDQDGNNIINENANTITIGASGDTISIPAGATLANAGTATGFASIAWQSSIVTAATHTAAAGQGLWLDTSSNAITLTLPASPSVGDQVIFTDYARNWATNAVTLTLNGSKFQGNTTPVPVYDTNGESVDIVFSGTTKGWIPNTDGAVALETPQVYDIDFLVIAGGAGGGGRYYSGGGGAGGFRTSTQTIDIGTSITVTVGDGGTGGQGTNDKGVNGSNSSISGTGVTTITSTGGGGGGAGGSGTSGVGLAGGSGGGGSGYNTGGAGGGAGNTPSVSPSQGNNGGGNNASPEGGGGGGGGASAVGETPTSQNGGYGGDGSSSSITGSAVTYGGGGGGADCYVVADGGAGGAGGGGKGANTSNDNTAGTANTGGGGGGSESGNGSAGGKGVVILSVPDGDYSGTTTGSPTVATGVSGKTVLTFTGTGSYTT